MASGGKGSVGSIRYGIVVVEAEVWAASVAVMVVEPAPGVAEVLIRVAEA